MRAKRKLKIVAPILLIILMLTACRVGVERYELTNYIGKSASTFEKKSGIELEKQSNGVYIVTDVVQVMVTDKDVTAITLLKNAGEYTVFGVGIGMSKADADLKLVDLFGKEIAKTINSSNNSMTYSYLNNEKELYISYDIDKETVVELTYYKVKIKKEGTETEESANAGELIAMIGDKRVYYNEAMVYLKSAQENYESDYGNNVWGVDILGNGETFGNMIKEEVMNQITELKIIRAEAKKQDITLSEEELADANAYAKEHFEGLTTEDINQYLITEELLQQVYADNLLASKMFETLTINVDTNVPVLDAKQITVQHILINNVRFDEEGNKITLSTVEKAEAYDKIKSLLEQAKLTEDFYALAEANTEAEIIEYTFGRGKGPVAYSAAFEQAAFTLKTGQVSDIISTDYGWHILFCVSDYNEDATIQIKEAIIEQRRTEMFAELYTEWSANYDVVVNSEAWDAVSYED
ncbi:MAG: peptidylprolyl isomerase [Mobilitalea sp.]